MAPGNDPYRALGLEPGATPAEIKRAYRRLAKAYHPDSAGERALPRFLAIQAAYERLSAGQPGATGSAARDPASRRGARPAPPPPPQPSRPWSADAERARATRDAFRKRSTRTRSGTPGSASGTSGGASPGSGAAGPSGGADQNGSDGGRPASGRGSGRRGRPKATIGSTSYDGTENEPFEPGWSGATWYGAASGTYWTINPKEYADPRKHGPEYLARARRNPKASAGPGVAPEADPPASEPAGATGPASGPAQDPEGATAPAEPRVDERPAGDAAQPSSGGPAASQPSSSSPPRPARRTRPTVVAPIDMPGDRRPPAGTAATAPPQPAAHRFGGLEPSRIASSWRGRILLAVLAWLPLGLAIFGVHGEVTGCSRFLASCTDPVAWSVWIPQVAAFLVLLASPRLAWIAASGTILLLAATVPLAAVLTAGSGGRPPSTATTELLYAAMAVGWLAGVAIALSGRIPLPPWRAARVR
ncbi:MAG TPA: DnaJ domain-containing protein [Candidatus Limnocylindrales bacterium]